MLTVPPKLASAYNRFLVKKNVPQKYQPFYRKWFRYYLDFCHKYIFDQADENSLSAFIAKLQDKKQAEFMQKQASQAVEIFHEMCADSTKSTRDDSGAGVDTLEKNAPANQLGRRHEKKPEKNTVQQNSRKKMVSGEPVIEKETGADWTGLYNELERAIKIRHYSPKTLQSYRGYTRQFQNNKRGQSEFKPFLFSTLTAGLFSSTLNAFRSSLQFLP